MNNHLERLGRRVEEDPFFLAYYLRLHAKSEGMDEGGLANALGCSPEILVKLRLCRAPGVDAEQFQKDVDQIVKRFRIDADVLAQVVRRGQAIFHMAQPASKMRGTLLAARDAVKERGSKRQQEGK